MKDADELLDGNCMTRWFWSLISQLFQVRLFFIFSCESYRKCMKPHNLSLRVWLQALQWQSRAPNYFTYRR